MTGGRVKRLEKWVSDETFMLTYGDGLSNINLKELLEFHQKHGKFATITAVRPPARFGELIFNNDFVINFTEKPLTTESWINGGFFVLEPEVFDYIKDDMTIWEREPLENLAKENQLVGYRLEGFWQCMDNLRDLRYLRSLWDSGNPPWKLWEE
jgi:glucose-1-phosphate cytidylyltransferase